MTIMSKVDHLELVTDFPSIHSISIYIVDDTGIEPVTPTMSMWCSTAEPIVLTVYCVNNAEKVYLSRDRV